MNFKKAVFFGAHTDDEMVCAGTLHRLVREGCEVHVVTFAPAATIEDRQGGALASSAVVYEWNVAMDAIGIRDGHRLYLGMVPSVDLAPFSKPIRQVVFDFCEREKPDAAFILSSDDENPAHAVVGRECEAVLRGRVPWAVRCHYPWNYTIGRNNLYISLTGPDMEAKVKVIEAYKSQHFRYRYGDIFMNQVRVDGGSVKVEAAEKFELIRGVV